MVGTEDGSKESTFAGSNGTQTRPANINSVSITGILEISFTLHFIQTNAN